MQCASSTVTPKPNNRLFLFRLLGIVLETAQEARPEGFRVRPGETVREALARSAQVDRDNQSGLLRAATLKWVHDMVALALLLLTLVSCAIPLWFLHR